MCEKNEEFSKLDFPMIASKLASYSEKKLSSACCVCKSIQEETNNVDLVKKGHQKKILTV